MYIITHNTENQTVQINNSSAGVFSEIHLNDGASLQALTLNHKALIQDLSPLNYESTYASSVLFPFANRIEDGVYSFEDKEFQLFVNNKEENNALHGLVYDKLFSVKEAVADQNRAHLVLEYIYSEPVSGFPFPFRIQFTYTVTQNGLDLNVLVENTGEASFPFTMGWHPYFSSENLDASSLEFESRKKLNIGHRNLGLSLETIPPTDGLSLKIKNLDDCWQLESNEVVFKTPNYKVLLASSDPNNFLQVYTPPKANTVAIEPTTGVSNSFNTKIGLRVLDPKEEFNITWSLSLD